MEKTDKKKIDTQVTDIESRLYTLSDEIGGGSQGRVFRVKNDLDIAVKLAVDTNGEALATDEAIKSVSEKLQQIRMLPIPADIILSKPLAILKSHAGYVMTFMNGMKSFDFFLKLHEQVSEEEIPNWLKAADGKAIPDAEIWTNYCKTGSLRLRFLALYKIAETISALHANGLVYGDISAGNLMFKKDGEKIIAGLIDADNINFAGKSKTYTPGYGAPEVMTEKSHTTIFSDAYAFAVAAFYIITMLHPFKGSKVLGETNDDDDWANSVISQQKADPDSFKDEGTYPWIFDADDDSNAYGSLEQVNSLFLTPTLFALFDNTFAEGHTRPHLRTPVSRWASAFAEAADLTVQCPMCKMTHYYNNEENGERGCPYCGKTHSPMLLALSKRNSSDNSKESNVIRRYAHELEKSVRLPRRCFEPFRPGSSDEDCVQFVADREFVEVSALLENETIYMSVNGGDYEILAGKKVFRLSDLLAKKAVLCFCFKKSYFYSVTVEFYGDER